MRNHNFAVAIAVAIAATIVFAAFGSVSVAHFASAQSTSNVTSSTTNASTAITAPTIVIKNPKAGAILDSSSFTVNGTATGTNLANVTVSIGNGQPSLATGTKNWTFAAAGISDGRHTIRATAEDSAGANVSAARTVTVDTTKPTVSITSPTEGAALNSGSFSISGKANDTNLANVTVSIDGNMSKLATGSANWSSSASNLKDGTHKIVATATDLAGNQASNTTTVTVSTQATTTASTNATTTTTTAQAAGTSLVQQGTIASNTTGFANVLAARTDAVYTGTISYTAGTTVELYILHAYGATNQNLNSDFSTPMTIKVDNRTYAVSVITNAGSSGDSGSIVFSGNGLMLHGGSPFLAVYTLKATVDSPTIVNNFTSAVVTTTASVNSTSTASSNTTSTANTTTSNSGNATSSSMSSTASIVLTGGSGTVTVKGTGFTPSTEVTTTINGDSSTATSTETDTNGAFDSSLLIDSGSGSILHIQTRESGGQTATADFTVP
jgi:large repetitive protein